MALDPKLAPPDLASAPAIENEIPAYRAISPMAITSLVLGVISVFCFAHSSFLIASAAAVVVGVLAERKIRRFPDLLTGRGFAQAGIALGLVFGLASVTTATVQGYLRSNAAAQFARAYAKVLQEKSFEDALWYQTAPSTRKNKTGEQVVKEMKEGAPDPQAFDMQTASLRELKTRLAADKDLKVEFSRIETHGVDGLTVYAAALLKIGEPGGDHGHPDEYAMVVMKSDGEGARYEWRVEEIQFPYKPDTFTHTPEAPAGGHGHAH